MEPLPPKDDPTQRWGLRAWFNRGGLRPKVTLLLLGLSLTPLIVADFNNVYRANQHGKAAVEAEHQLNAKFAAHIFEKHFDRIHREAEILASRLPLADLREVLQRRVPFTSIRRWREDSFLRELRPCIGAILLTTPDGEVLYSDPFSARKPNVAAQPWFKTLRDNGGLVMGGLEPFTPAKGFNFMNLTPLRGTHGAVEGHLIMVIRSCILEPLLKEAAYFKPPHSTLLLTSPERQIALYEGPAALGTISKAFEFIKPGETRELDFRGKSYLISRVSLGDWGWTVFLQTEERQAYHYVHELSWHLAAVVLLTFLFVLLLADNLAGRLLSPIQELERGAKMIGSEILTYRIELDHQRDNEIGRLAMAFNAMAENLERKKKDLKTYSHTLESTNQELDALVFAIGNDLAKHLRAISGFAAILSEEYRGRLDEEDTELLDHINTNVSGIQTLMENLLHFVNHDRDEEEIADFDLGTVLQEIAQQQRAHGEVKLIGDFPTLTADKKQWRLIFDNLISNGLKFNTSKAPRVTVRVESKRMHWFFVLEDNGIGIDEADQKSVFTLFTRLNHQDDFPGTGTGLSLTSRLIADHRGKLTLKSALGRGSTFTIQLPKKMNLRTTPQARLERLTDPNIKAL